MNVVIFPIEPKLRISFGNYGGIKRPTFYVLYMVCRSLKYCDSFFKKSITFPTENHSEVFFFFSFLSAWNILFSEKHIKNRSVSVF